VIYAIDPGPQNSGIVAIDRRTGSVSGNVFTAEDLLEYIYASVATDDVVIIESVTPRKHAFPGMWSRTLQIAEVIGALKWICKQVGAVVVMQNPSVIVPPGPRKKKTGSGKMSHYNDALAHYRYYERQSKLKPT
jgi:hypothetical protein